MATFRQPIKINNVTPLPNAGSTGKTITFYHPGNIRLHNTTFKVKIDGKPATRGQIAAAISRVEYLFGTGTFRDFSVDELLVIQDILGFRQVPGALTVHYSNPLIKTPFGEELTSWDLIASAPVPEFQIRLTLNMPAAGTSFDIEAITSADPVANLDANGRPNQRFEAMKRFGGQLVGGAEQSYFEIPRTRPFARLWLFGDTLPTRVQLKRDKIKIYDLRQTAADPELAVDLAKGGMAPLLKADGTVDKAWPVILNPNNYVSDFLDISPLNALELITDMPATARVDFVIEQFFATPGAA